MAKPVEEAPAAEEPATEPAADDPAEEEKEEEEVKFAGTLGITPRGYIERAVGTRVVLGANVTGANMGYSLAWQSKKADGNWITIANGSDTYVLTVAENLNDVSYRVVLTAENGEVLSSGSVTIIVKDTADPGEELQEQPEENPEEQPEENLEEQPEEEPEENPEEEPEEEPEENPEEQPEEDAEEEPEEESEEEPEEDPEANMKVWAYSSRRPVMHKGETVTLSSKIEGFDGYTVSYQWKCDKHDGNGFQKVPGANGDTHTFKATAESLSWDWKLEVTYQ